MEDSRVRILLELRRELEEELNRVQERLSILQNYIKALDSTISTTSFATADSALGSLEPTEKTAAKNQIDDEAEGPRTIEVLKKDREMKLATMKVMPNEIVITPAEHAVYDITRGAFARFFVERVLGGFQLDDKRRVENGEISWDEAFDFDIKAEDSILKEIKIKNYSNDERLEEIKKALRWALEKTYRAR